jgi:ParB family chromosome partitioning protein
MSKKRGLGKGFESLIPTTIEPEFDPTAEVDTQASRTQNILISAILPNRGQPRQEFTEQHILELAESIKTHGVLQPIVVHEVAADSYRIIAGERRWRAAKKAGLKDIPAIIRTTDAQSELEIALIENVQREDLNPLEIATAFLKLHDQFQMDYEEIAKKVGKSTSLVANHLRLLRLPKPIKRALVKGKITEGHARAILSLEGDEKAQQTLLDLILRHQWSVRRTEAYVGALKTGADSPKTAIRAVQTETPQTKKLAKQLKAPVTIYKKSKGGRIQIEFKNDAELHRITEELLR